MEIVEKHLSPVSITAGRSKVGFGGADALGVSSDICEAIGEGTARSAKDVSEGTVEINIFHRHRKNMKIENSRREGERCQRKT